MPSYHIWIRKEDETKWKAIENKPEWLHERLNHSKSFRSQNLYEQVKTIKDKITEDFPEPTITEPEDVA